MKRMVLALAVMACAAVPAAAQDMAETVVVTGYRSSDSGSMPHVVLIRRADHLITTITVTDDTRDSAMRVKEMRETLRALIKQAAGSKNISLSIEGTVLRAFDESQIYKVMRPDSRPDTSKAVIVVKTAIEKGDTYDSATGRISDFVKKAQKFGRSEVINDEDWELTIVGPQQYHAAVVAKVAEDAKATAAMFGPDYGVVMGGLENPLQWYRAGQLDLALYLNYSMTVQPRKN
jgi:hypothetical protein